MPEQTVLEKSLSKLFQAASEAAEQTFEVGDRIFDVLTGAPPPLYEHEEEGEEDATTVGSTRGIDEEGVERTLVESKPSNADTSAAAYQQESTILNSTIEVDDDNVETSLMISHLSDDFPFSEEEEEEDFDVDRVDADRTLTSSSHNMHDDTVLEDNSNLLMPLGPQPFTSTVPDPDPDRSNSNNVTNSILVGNRSSTTMMVSGTSISGVAAAANDTTAASNVEIDISKSSFLSLSDIVPDRSGGAPFVDMTEEEEEQEQKEESDVWVSIEQQSRRATSEALMLAQTGCNNNNNNNNSSGVDSSGEQSPISPIDALIRPPTNTNSKRLKNGDTGKENHTGAVRKKSVLSLDTKESDVWDAVDTIKSHEHNDVSGEHHETLAAVSFEDGLRIEKETRSSSSPSNELDTTSCGNKENYSTTDKKQDAATPTKATSTDFKKTKDTADTALAEVQRTVDEAEAKAKTRDITATVAKEGTSIDPSVDDGKEERKDVELPPNKSAVELTGKLQLPDTYPPAAAGLYTPNNSGWDEEVTPREEELKLLENQCNDIIVVLEESSAAIDDASADDLHVTGAIPTEEDILINDSAMKSIIESIDNILGDELKVVSDDSPSDEEPMVMKENKALSDDAPSDEECKATKESEVDIAVKQDSTTPVDTKTNQMPKPDHSAVLVAHSPCKRDVPSRKPPAILTSRSNNSPSPVKSRLHIKAMKLKESRKGSRYNRNFAKSSPSFQQEASPNASPIKQTRKAITGNFKKNEMQSPAKTVDITDMDETLGSLESFPGQSGKQKARV